MFGSLAVSFFKLVPKKAELETVGPATTEPFKLIGVLTAPTVETEAAMDTALIGFAQNRKVVEA
ncbi:hypothetical protein CDL35_05645, partial [Escherichia coli]